MQPEYMFTVYLYVQSVWLLLLQTDLLIFDELPDGTVEPLITIFNIGSQAHLCVCVCASMVGLLRSKNPPLMADTRQEPDVQINNSTKHTQTTHTGALPKVGSWLRRTLDECQK